MRVHRHVVRGNTHAGLTGSGEGQDVSRGEFPEKRSDVDDVLGDVDEEAEKRRRRIEAWQKNKKSRVSVVCSLAWLGGQSNWYFVI